MALKESERGRDANCECHLKKTEIKIITTITQTARKASTAVYKNKYVIIYIVMANIATDPLRQFHVVHKTRERTYTKT